MTWPTAGRTSCAAAGRSRKGRLPLNAGEAARQDLGPAGADDQFPPLSDDEYPGGEWTATETAVVTDSEHERFGSLSLPDQTPGSDEGAQPEPAAVAF